MSEQTAENKAVNEPAPPRQLKPRPGTLRARMIARAEELERRTTEIFPIPMFDRILAVELQPVAWAKTEELLQQHQRATAPMMATMAEEIVAGTVAFWEIKEDGSLEKVEDLHSWRQVADELAGRPVLDSAPERVAVVAVCTDQGVVALGGLFRQWMGGANVGIGQEVARDF